MKTKTNNKRGGVVVQLTHSMTADLLRNVDQWIVHRKKAIEEDVTELLGLAKWLPSTQCLCFAKDQ